MRTNISYIITISLFLSLPSSIVRGQAYTYDKDFHLELDIERIGDIKGLYEEENRFFIWGGFNSKTNWTTDNNLYLFNKDGSRNYSFQWYYQNFPVSGFRISQNGFMLIKVFSPTSKPILFGPNGEIPFDFPEGLEYRNNTINIDLLRNTHTAMLIPEPNRFNQGVILPDGSYINTMSTNRPFWTEDSIHYQDTAKEMSMYKILPDGKFDSVVFQHKINKGMPYETAFLEWGITTFNDTDLYIAGIFENYDGYPIRNLLKINTYGELDTNFKSIITGGVAFPMAQMEDGRILLGWSDGFTIEGYPGQVFTMIRIFPDGTLDTSFRMLPFNYEEFYGACATEDGGFIVWGVFETFAGYNRNRIVKINYDGTVDETAFAVADLGKEYNTILNPPSYPMSVVVHKVQRSLDGQYYYVMGNFVEYNGEPVPKIIRFKSETFSTKEENKLAFQLFPNPTTDYVYLQLENTENVNYRITDITGKIMAQNTWNGQAISVENLNSGVYFITLLNKNEILGTQKIIKQ